MGRNGPNLPSYLQSSIPTGGGARGHCLVGVVTISCGRVQAGPLAPRRGRMGGRQQSGVHDTRREQAEHERLEKEEAAKSRATGIAQWELRIQFASDQDAIAFTHRLQQEDFTYIVRRFHYLLVGTVNEDAAKTWAGRLKDELPPGATIHVEPGSGLAWEYMPQNRFALMGALGG
jgi:hypothetical protein